MCLSVSFVSAPIHRRWMAPLTMSIEMVTTGNPGIVCPFIFKGDGDKGEEVSDQHRERRERLFVHERCFLLITIPIRAVLRPSR